MHETGYRAYEEGNIMLNFLFYSFPSSLSKELEMQRGVVMLFTM